MRQRIVRWCGRAVLGVVGLLVVLVVAVIVVNLKDQALDTRAAALLQRPPARAIETDNGFPDFLGLKAPAGVDAREWGQRWLAESAAVTDATAAAAFHAKFSERGADSIPLFCNPTAAACLERAVNARAVTVALLEAHGDQLARYQRLFGYAQMDEIHEIATPVTPIVTYHGIFATQGLHFAQVALKVADGDLNGALDLLERDVQLQRRLLVGSTYLLTKAVALELFTRDVALLSQVLRRRRTDMAARAERAARMAAPLTAAERSMDAAFKAEFRVFANFLLQIGQPAHRGDLAAGLLPAFLAPWLYQPNASINLQYRLYEPIFAMDTTKAPRTSAPYRAPFDPAGDWTLPYNVVGKTLLSRGVPDFADYPSLVADVDGLRRLVALQAAIVGRRLTNERVPAYLAEADRAVADPYTEQPMQWDAQAAQLGFEPRSEKWRNQKFGGRPDWLAITL